MDEQGNYTDIQDEVEILRAFTEVPLRDKTINNLIEGFQSACNLGMKLNSYVGESNRKLITIKEQMIKMEKEYENVIEELCSLKQKHLDKIHSLRNFEKEKYVLGQLIGLTHEDYVEIEGK